MKKEYHILLWADFKSNIDSRGLSVQEVKNYIKGTSTIQTYDLYLYDGDFKAMCVLYNDGSMQTEIDDYVNNYQTSANQPIKDRDDTGREVTRGAATDKGWAYLAHPIEFTTAKKDSVYSRTWKEEDRGSSVVRFYDSSDTELTDQSVIDTDCVKTVLTIKLGHDFDIVSGMLEQLAPPVDGNGDLVDVRMWVVMGIIDNDGIPFDPDGGGSTYLEQVTEFVGGLNLKFFSSDSHVKTDGRAGKKLFKIVNPAIPYDQNQIQFILRHPAGFKHELMPILEYFRKP